MVIISPVGLYIKNLFAQFYNEKVTMKKVLNVWRFITSLAVKITTTFYSVFEG